VAFVANHYPPSATAEHFPGFSRASETKPAQLIGRFSTSRARRCQCETPLFAFCERTFLLESAILTRYFHILPRQRMLPCRRLTPSFSAVKIC
jgi:hypothetical protein